MYRTIKSLFAASVFLTLCSITSLYVGSRAAAAAAPAPAVVNPLAAQFGGDPGDGWMLAGLFLMLVAVAFASAGLMLGCVSEKGREGGDRRTEGRVARSFFIVRPSVTVSPLKGR